MRLNFARRIALLTLAALLCIAPSAARADEEQAAGHFLPTWKLLNQQQKSQFIAGYIYGWHDAAKITEVAITFVRENPGQAVQGLERVKALYNLSNIKPDIVVKEIDHFFSEPENHNASFALAMSAARLRLQ